MLRFAGNRFARHFKPTTFRVPLVTQKQELSGLTIGVLKEQEAGENRVAIIPAHVEQLIKKGAKVQVQSGAGENSGFRDEQYKAAGAEIAKEDDVWKNDLVIKIRAPKSEDAKKLNDRHFIGLLYARQNQELINQFATQKATVFSLDMLLRTLSRGQAFDVLSSQANIAGYKAVIEAANLIQRPFAGQMTAAGRIPPTKVLVVGAGVAGLAAIQTAKGMGAQVVAFDVRSAAKEQVKALGANFIEVRSKETGDAAGGYAKEMSPEWFEAANQVLLEECKTINIIITTALIPGRKAPVLITKEMVAAMPSGSVTIDLAAESGGNVETTVRDKVVQVGNVTCVGYANFPSRLSTTASTLFSGNVTKFVLSMERDKKFIVDLNDEAVRSMCVVEKGNKLEPYVQPAPSTTQPETSTGGASADTKAVVVVSPEEQMRKTATIATGVGAAAVAIGATVPGALLPTFALSVLVGSQAVRGVSHALHSPLMSITNAISGMTIIGGMLQLNGGLLPTNVPQGLALTAVVLSAINLSGGFIVTKKMLNLFRRPTDPPEYFHYLLAPFGVVGGGYGLAVLSGFACPSLAATVALASGLGCIGGISTMSSQSTARAAIYVGMGGVGLGLVSALSAMNVSGPVYIQLLGGAALGGLIGQQIAARVGPTQLPQAIAGFHTLVGVAATSTAIGEFLSHGTALSTFHSFSVYAGAWMGAITATGSIVACLKLAEKMSSKPLMLANRDQYNIAMAIGSVVGLVGFLTISNPLVAGTCLVLGTTFSGLLGYHMTASIGGADMPVVVTLLNSYSGWALCAEGFILDQPLLTIVGALIGSSGAFLTKIMCDGMNRSLVNVISGGFGTEEGTVQTAVGQVHKEIDVNGTVQALLDASKVVIIPGYGLAVAQAQGFVAQIAEDLRKLGKTVVFGVHPVAGRLPGQLNVLLAEAGVPYDIVQEMEEVNHELDNCEVALVVGANDTVNSSAEEDPKSAIAGMPVIRVWKANQVIFMKRSMASGYSGADNPVFYKANTDMLLGNAKDTTAKIAAAISERVNR